MDNGKSRLLEEDNTELRQQRESADEDDGATAIIHHYESATTVSHSTWTQSIWLNGKPQTSYPDVIAAIM